MIRRLFHSPTARCLALGAVLAWGLGAVAPARLEISAAALAQLEDQWLNQHGIAPTEADRLQMLQELADEEILYRIALRRHMDQLPVVQDRLEKLGSFLQLSAGGDAEDARRQARALGLEQSDPLIRRYLVASARQALTAELAIAAIDDDEIRAYYAAQAAEFRAAEQRRVSHVFVGGLDAAAERRAQRLLLQAQAESWSVEAALARGDAFYGGHHLPALKHTQLARRLGEDPANAVFDAKPGQWIGPVASVYGYHLLWVHDIRPARPIPLEQVAGRIANRLQKQRREHALAQKLERLRAQYHIVLTGDASPDMTITAALSSHEREVGG